MLSEGRASPQYWHMLHGDRGVRSQAQSALGTRFQARLMAQQEEQGDGRRS